ncbi:MAG: carbonic anhydrase [Candidatus Obscuribacterales bacterium]|nr:carbonic anhydrase [Candidatus Obscuribacterales bacterium]
MKKLIKGLHQFRTETFLNHKELFERLSHGQSPDALFITCSDSRINPNLITHTDPGDLFIIRNAGNIVPPQGTSVTGEIATIEYALVALGIKDIIICGHTLCGAMQGLLEDKLESMPAVAEWLKYAEATRRLLKDVYNDIDDPDALATIATQENVLVQLEHLRTLPPVASALSRGKLNIHGWVYKIQTGEVFAYDPDMGQFLSISKVSVFQGAGGLRKLEARSI